MIKYYLKERPHDPEGNTLANSSVATEFRDALEKGVVAEGTLVFAKENKRGRRPQTSLLKSDPILDYQLN